MAVANLITPVDPSGVFPSIPADSDRVVFLTVNVYQTTGGLSATAPSGVTLGGVSGTFVGGDAPSLVQVKATLSTWMFNEAQIAAMSGSAIVITGQNGAATKAIAWGVKGASQSVTSRKNNAYVTTGGITMSLDRVADSWTFFPAFVSVAEDITLTNPTRTSRINLVNIGYSAGTAQTVNSTTQSKTYVQTAHVLNIEPVPAYLINSTNSGDAVKVGSSFSSSVTGFTGIASGTIGGKALSSLSYSTNSITATAPSFVDGQTFYEPDTNQTLTYVNGSETASATIPTASPDTMASVKLVSPNSADPTYPAYYFPMTADDRMVGPTEGGNFVIGTDSGISTTTAGTRVCWHWNHTTQVMTQLNITVNEAGQVTSFGLTSAGLTSIGLTRVGLTSSGL